MKDKRNSLVIERLTALWALSECGLGGIMHAFGSPFTGIVVGGVSVLLITLIASHSKAIYPTLLKALSIVLLIKLGVSPHSPITAYIAVSFQALLGIALFSLFSVNKLSIILLGATTFLESALQKLATLTIIYGRPLWDSLDAYITWVSEKLTFLAPYISPEGILISFVLFYTVSGIFISFVIIRILNLIRTVDVGQYYIPQPYVEAVSKDKIQGKRTKKLILFWSCTILFILLPLVFFKDNYQGLETGLYLLARSALVIISWYFIIGPLLLKGLNMLLSKHRATYQADLQNTLTLIPYLKDIVRHSWRDSESFYGITRLQHFLAKSIVYSVHFKSANE